ncbi:MAG: hypothetical protein JNN04_06530 [Cyclobacteriaceae bacterium]|nr:hypothetical protein [Cyclobacteriaceae bacterium]
MEVTLFHEEREDIRIDIVAYFEQDTLVIDGYDIGKTVKDYWGDSDYEYGMRIYPEGVQKLYAHFSLAPDPSQLLALLADRFSGNRCFSQLESLVDQLKLPHESYKWT